MLAHFPARIAVCGLLVFAGSLGVFRVNANQRVDGNVPAVVGMSAQDAKAAIEKSGLTAEFHLGSAAPSAEKRLKVVEQVPGPGAKLPKGSRVKIIIYQNKVELPNTPVTRGVVPDLTGRPAAEAKQLADQAGLTAIFRMGVTAPDARQSFLAYAQQPKPTTQLAAGGRVEITLYDRAVAAAHADSSHLVQVSAIPFLNQSSETIDPHSGQLFAEATDLVVRAGSTKLEIKRALKQHDESSGLLGSRWRLNWEKRVFRGPNVAVILEGAAPTYFAFHSAAKEFTSVAGDYLAFDDSGAVCTRINGSREIYDSQGRLIEVNDPNENKILLRYDASGQLARIDGPFQTFLRLVCDREGRLTTVRSSNGAMVRYAYGAQETLMDSAGESELIVRYGYDATGQLSSIDHPQTGMTKFVWDLPGRVIQRRWADDTFERYEYDDNQRIVRHFDPVGRLTSITSSVDGMAAKVTNPVGLTMSMERDPAGRLVSMEGSSGRRARVRYDAEGRIASVDNSIFGETRFEYAETGRNPEACIGPDGMRQRFEYDEHNNLCRLVTETMAASGSRDADSPSMGKAIGPSIEADYFPNGLLKKISTNDGREATLTYDQRGSVTAVTDSEGLATKLEYDERDNLIRHVDPLGNQTRWEYDKHNRRTKVTFSDGGFMRFEYSRSGLLARQVDHKGRCTEFEYDKRGRVVRETGPHGQEQQYEYCPDGQLKSITDHLGNRTSFEYNDLRLLARETLPTGREISYSYDKLGNLIAWQDNLGMRQTLGYDIKGRISSTSNSLDAAVRIRRDDDGQAVTIIDQCDGVKQLRYNDARQLEEVQSANGDRARYKYDQHGRITTIHHPGTGSSTVAYDAVGNIVEMTTPIGESTTLDYDAFDRVIRTTDAKGQVTSYTYDRLNRLVRKELADGKVVHYAYDDDGNLARVDDGEFPVHFAYDDNGNRTKIEYPALKKTLEYQYDAESRLVASIDLEGHRTEYEYDRFGQLVTIKVGDGQVTRLTYDQAGHTTSIAYPNGVRGTWTYDPEKRLTEMNYVDGDGNVFAGWQYSYDAAGNPVELREAEGDTIRYAYDPSGQITQEEIVDGAVTHYSYVAGGNRSARETTDEKIAYKYDEADRLLEAGDETFSYDKNGNLVERSGPKGVTRYEYDAENQLVRVSLPDGKSVRFGYSPLGERIWREDSNGRHWFVTDGVNLVAELDETLTPQATYLHGLGVDRPLMMLRKDQDYFVHVDLLGSVRSLTDGDGESVATYGYDAFGRINRHQGEIECPLTYTAREFDEAIGLYYYRSRYYDAELGRFISADVYRGAVDDPLSLNRYAYVNNAPTRFIDSLGAAPQEPRKTAGSNTVTADFGTNLLSGPMLALGRAGARSPESYIRTYSSGVAYVGSRGPLSPRVAQRLATQAARNSGGARLAGFGTTMGGVFTATGLVRANVYAKNREQRVRDSASIIGGTLASYVATAALFGSNPAGWIGIAGSFVVGTAVNIGVSSVISDALTSGSTPVAANSPLASSADYYDAMSRPRSPDTDFWNPSLIPTWAANAPNTMVETATNLDKERYWPGGYPPATVYPSANVLGGSGLPNRDDDDYLEQAEALVDLVIQREAGRLDRELTDREIAAARERVRDAQTRWENGPRSRGGNYDNQGYWNDWADRWAQEFEESFGGNMGYGNYLGPGMF